MFRHNVRILSYGYVEIVFKITVQIDHASKLQSKQIV